MAGQYKGTVENVDLGHSNRMIPVIFIDNCVSGTRIYE
jgi:hypothetical protein